MKVLKLFILKSDWKITILDLQPAQAV